MPRELTEAQVVEAKARYVRGESASKLAQWAGVPLVEMRRALFLGEGAVVARKPYAGPRFAASYRRPGRGRS